MPTLLLKVQFVMFSQINACQQPQQILYCSEKNLTINNNHYISIVNKILFNLSNFRIYFKLIQVVNWLYFYKFNAQQSLLIKFIINYTSCIKKIPTNSLNLDIVFTGNNSLSTVPWLYIHLLEIPYTFWESLKFRLNSFKLINNLIKQNSLLITAVGLLSFCSN